MGNIIYMGSVRKALWVLPAVMFGAGAVMKATNRSFEDYLTATEVVDPRGAAGVAQSVAWTEGVAAILLVWPRTRMIGAFAATGLAAGYAAFHVCMLMVGDGRTWPFATGDYYLNGSTGQGGMLAMCGIALLAAVLTFFGSFSKCARLGSSSERASPPA